MSLGVSQIYASFGDAQRTLDRPALFYKPLVLLIWIGPISWRSAARCPSATAATHRRPGTARAAPAGVPAE
jgi:hypothetical protein